MEWLYRVGFTYKGKDYEEVYRFSEKVEPRAVLESFVKEFTKLPNVKTSEIKEIRLFYLSPHDFGNEKKYYVLELLYAAGDYAKYKEELLSND